jgi:hypothetical protein
MSAVPPPNYFVVLIKESESPIPDSYANVLARSASICDGVKALVAASQTLSRLEQDGGDSMPDAALSTEKTRILVCTNPFTEVDAVNAVSPSTCYALAAVCAPFDQEWKARRFAMNWSGMSRGAEARSMSGCALAQERGCAFYIDPCVVFGAAVLANGAAADGTPPPVATAISS